MFGWLNPRTWKRSLENPALSLSNPETFLKLFGTEADAGITITAENALSVATYWQCIHLLADDFAKLPTVVYKSKKEDGHEKDREHPAYYLLRRKTSEYMTAGVFKKTLLGHALNYGNGYGWIIRNGAYEPEEILILDPTKTCPKFDAEGTLWYETTLRNKKYTLKSDEIFHLRGLGFDGLKGYSVIHFARNSLGLTIAAEKYGSKFFANGSRSSGVLHYPGRLKPEASKNLADSFEARHQGLENAHRTIVLEEGAKYVPLTINPNEAQFKELREFQRKEVASWFKVPPSKLGDPDSVSYNSLEQWNQSYLESALDPWLCAFEEEAEDKLLTETQKHRESHFIEFNRAALLRTALNERYTAYATARQWGWYSVNDIRRKESETPIGSEGDVYLVPQNMADLKNVGQLGQKPDAGKTAGPNGPDGNEPKSKDKTVKAKRELLEDTFGRMVRRLTGTLLKAAKGSDFWDRCDELLNEYQSTFVRIVSPVANVIAITEPTEWINVARFADAHTHAIKRELQGLVNDEQGFEQRLAKWATDFELRGPQQLSVDFLGRLDTN